MGDRKDLDQPGTTLVQPVPDLPALASALIRAVFDAEAMLPEGGTFGMRSVGHYFVAGLDNFNQFDDMYARLVEAAELAVIACLNQARTEQVSPPIRESISLDPKEGMGADLTALIQKACANYEAMSPVDKALHDADQRRSFVRGQAGRDPGPDVLADEVRRLSTLLSEAKRTLEQADTALMTALDCVQEHEPAGTTKARRAVDAAIRQNRATLSKLREAKDG